MLNDFSGNHNFMRIAEIEMLVWMFNADCKETGYCVQ